jgi:hypothetical protein
MPTKEGILKTQTFKDYGLDVEVRVHSTLIQDRELKSDMLQAERNSKAIAHLFQTLVDAGTISEEQLDDILLHVVTYLGVIDPFCGPGPFRDPRWRQPVWPVWFSTRYNPRHEPR